jgi:hypothetical protein
MKHHKKGSQEEIITGAAFTLLFSILYFQVGGWFWIFPLIFAGFLPLVRGLVARYANRSAEKRPRENSKEARIKREKEILKLAKAKQGVLTVTTASLESSLSLEETEKVLSDLSDRGYARMEVEDDGSITYRFPDFMGKPSLTE